MNHEKNLSILKAVFDTKEKNSHSQSLLLKRYAFFVLLLFLEIFFPLYPGDFISKPNQSCVTKK
jgi:hypothetical protein